MKFVTTKGDFVIHVTRAWAPHGADRFYNLVKHHFYDGAIFPFVDGFVVQFGLTGNPAVNKAWTNANIKDDPPKQSNKTGYITFAMAGKDTRTTQVFINLGDNSRLDAMGFSVFGQVTSGMDVVKSLYSGYADAPTSHRMKSRIRVRRISMRIFLSSTASRRRRLLLLLVQRLLQAALRRTKRRLLRPPNRKNRSVGVLPEHGLDILIDAI